MTVITEKITAAFNKAAPYYDQFDAVQKKIGMRLIGQLSDKFFNRVIDLGCGTGWVTRALAERILFHHFDAIDIAELMIAEAENNCSNTSIQFRTGSFDSLLENSYDLIFSNLALHWSADFNKTLTCIHSALKLGGYFAFSMPLPGTFEDFRDHFSVHDFQSAREILNTLTKLNFRIIQSEDFHESLTFNSTLETLRALKKTGVTVCEKSSHSFKENRFLIKQNVVNKLDYHISTYIVEKHE